MYKIFKMILSDKTGISNILFPFRGGGHCFSAHATPAPRTISNAPPLPSPADLRPASTSTVHLIILQAAEFPIIIAKPECVKSSFFCETKKYNYQLIVKFIHLNFTNLFIFNNKNIFKKPPIKQLSFLSLQPQHKTQTLNLYTLNL